MKPPSDDSARRSGEPKREVLRAVVDGRPEAVDAWFRSEYPDVHRLCFGFLADAAEAEDAAQEAMLHVMDRLDSWHPERSYRAWRNTLVLNLCRDRQRRADARRRAHLRAHEVREQAPLPDPLRELERAEVQRELRSALEALTPREREAFVLRDLDEQPTDPQLAGRLLTAGDQQQDAAPGRAFAVGFRTGR